MQTLRKGGTYLEVNTSRVATLEGFNHDRDDGVDGLRCEGK